MPSKAERNEAVLCNPTSCQFERFPLGVFPSSSGSQSSGLKKEGNFQEKF